MTPVDQVQVQEGSAPERSTTMIEIRDRDTGAEAREALTRGIA